MNTGNSRQFSNRVPKENLLGKNGFKQFILFFLFVIVFCIPTTGKAESSTAADGKSAIAHVRFKVIIAPSLTLNVGTFSPGNLVTAQPGVEDDSPSSLTRSSKGQYALTFSPKNINLRPPSNGPRSYILCSP